MTRLMWGILAVLVNLAAAGLLEAYGVAPGTSAAAMPPGAYLEQRADASRIEDSAPDDAVYAAVAAPTTALHAASATVPKNRVPAGAVLCAMQTPAPDEATSSQCSTCPLPF